MAGKKKAGGKAIGSARRGTRAKPTKAEEVEVQAKLKLLLPNLAASDKDALYHYSTILGLMDKAKTASGKVGDAKKKAKEAGIDVAALMAVMTLKRMDPIDLAGYLKEQARMMQALDMPIQLGLYESDFKNVGEQAYSFGFSDGKAARSMNTKLYKEGQPGYEDYARGWRAGQAENQKGIKAPEKAEETPPPAPKGGGGRVLKVVGGADAQGKADGDAEGDDWT